MADDPIIKDAAIFRAGNYGPKGSYTEASLDGVVKRFEDAGENVPITTDHKHTGPAAGWATKIWRKGSELWARLEINPAFAELVKAKAFAKRSIEMHRNPHSLRAVTFLGAGKPEIKGLPDLVFASEAEFDSFELLEEDTVTFEEKRENGQDYDSFQAVTKRERGIDFPPRAFLFVPDVHAPSTWKLRVWEDLEKKVTRRQLGLAAAAFAPGGFRGRRVQLPANQVQTIKRRLRALYGSIGVAEAAIPAQIRSFSLCPYPFGLETEGLDEVEFFEWHFALCSDPTDPKAWKLLLYQDPNGDPDAKLVGRAIAHFSPGGFGEDHLKIKPTDPGYIGAKAAIIAACEQIGKDPAWAAFKDSDILYDPAITVAALVDSRPDILASFKEEYTTSHEEENDMPKDTQELQNEVADLKASKTELEAKFAESEAKAEIDKAKLATDLEEKTSQFNEANGQLTEMKAKEAKAALLKELQERVAKAELRPEFSEDLIARFSDAENLDGLDAAIEVATKQIASFSTPESENIMDDMPADETTAGTKDLMALANAYADKHKVPYERAFVAVCREK